MMKVGVSGWEAWSKHDIQNQPVKIRPVEFHTPQNFKFFCFASLLLFLSLTLQSQTMSWGENVDFSGGNAGFGGDVDFSSGNANADFGGGDTSYSADNGGYSNGGGDGGDYDSYNDRPKFEPREGDWDCPE